MRPQKIGQIVCFFFWWQQLLESVSDFFAATDLIDISGKLNIGNSSFFALRESVDQLSFSFR